MGKFKEYPKVSIITTFHRILYINPQLFYNDFFHLQNLFYPDYEILIVSDKKVDIKLPNTRFITTGKKLTGPGEKRDIAVPLAKGEIVAFIDDDAYPDRYWLKEAVKGFEDPLVGVVCGPGVTPPEDSYLQKLGGLTLESEYCSGSTRSRFVPTTRGFVEDHPTYNMIVRKDLFLNLGGFNSTLWCGEDTKFCLAVINAGKKILYQPSAIVYHHRRKLLIPHIQQISNIGMHRGYFVKKYQLTSRKNIYFLPSIFTVGLFVAIVLALLFPPFRLPFLIGLSFIIYLYFSTTLPKTDPISALLVAFSIMLTHIVYGISFIRGLLTKELTR